MMKHLAILGVLLAGCGDFSHDPIEEAVAREDVQFKHALPSPSDVHLDAPDSSSQASGLTARSGLGGAVCTNPLATDIFCNGEAGVTALNALIGGILNVVDYVRTLPPTVRERDRRVWGEHPDSQHPLRTWRVEVKRARENGALTYRWTIQIRPRPRAAVVTVIHGSFIPGPSGTAEGVGELTIDGNAQRSIGDAADLDLLTVRYDLLSATRTIVTDATGRDGAHATFTRDSETSGAGGWTFEEPVAIGGNADRLSVRVRWNSQHAGRGDAKLTVPPGVSGAGDYFVRECWDETLSPTYWEQPAFAQCPQAGCVFGDERLCVYADLFSK